MSVEYFVALRSVLPARDGGWSFDVGAVSIHVLDDEELLGVLADEVAGVSAGLVFSGRSAAADMTLGLARVVARLLGGAVFYEDGPELVETFEAPSSPPDAATVEQAMRTWLAEDEARRATDHAAAKAAWVERMKKGNPDDVF
ncbi:MAG: hypothetical protein KIT84_22180 [Labilithrix sp.]|nr:hypothetical protein [Labilithrix sp.]MCW5813754.1 hypothetical protein [Labilithrix sp.]